MSASATNHNGRSGGSSSDDNSNALVSTLLKRKASGNSRTCDRVASAALRNPASSPLHFYHSNNTNNSNNNKWTVSGLVATPIRSNIVTPTDIRKINLALMPDLQQQRQEQAASAGGASANLNGSLALAIHEVTKDPSALRSGVCRLRPRRRVHNLEDEFRRQLTIAGRSGGGSGRRGSRSAGGFDTDGGWGSPAAGSDVEDDIDIFVADDEQAEEGGRAHENLPFVPY